MSYTISNSNGLRGRAWAAIYESRDDAAEAIRHAYAWDSVVLSDSYTTDGDADAWSAYETQDACDDDADGARAPRIVSVRQKTAKSVSDADLRALLTAAGQAGDMRQVGLCVLAIDGSIDYDDYSAIDADDRRWLASYTQESALAACVDAINDAAGR